MSSAVLSTIEGLHLVQIVRSRMRAILIVNRKLARQKYFQLLPGAACAQITPGHQV